MERRYRQNNATMIRCLPVYYEPPKHFTNLDEIESNDDPADSGGCAFHEYYFRSAYHSGVINQRAVRLAGAFDAAQRVARCQAPLT